MTNDKLYQDRKSPSASSTRKFVVVFDIDECLCSHNRLEGEKLKKVMQHLPECPVVVWDHITYSATGQEECDKYPHTFFPFIQILFDYLLGQGARIVFFSAAVKERNEKVVAELLESFWGTKKYETLRSEGQFMTFSKDDLILRRDRDPTDKSCGQYVKDLVKVIRDGESLSDIILVDDDSSYATRDQLPLIVVRNGYFLGEALNNIYYILGLFKTYFENDEYNKLPLRGGINKMFSEQTFEENNRYFDEKHPFSIRMINIGLLEVRKLIPEARLYTEADQFPQ